MTYEKTSIITSFPSEKSYWFWGKLSKLKFMIHILLQYYLHLPLKKGRSFIQTNLNYPSYYIRFANFNWNCVRCSGMINRFLQFVFSLFHYYLFLNEKLSFLLIFMFPKWSLGTYCSLLIINIILHFLLSSLNLLVCECSQKNTQYMYMKLKSF